MKKKKAQLLKSYVPDLNLGMYGWLAVQWNEDGAPIMTEKSAKKIEKYENQHPCCQKHASQWPPPPPPLNKKMCGEIIKREKETVNSYKITTLQLDTMYIF